MWDPKRIYEDRTPAPLVEAPRPVEERPVAGPLVPGAMTEAERKHARYNRARAARHARAVAKRAWKRQMRELHGKGWVKIWLATKER